MSLNVHCKIDKVVNIIFCGKRRRAERKKHVAAAAEHDPLPPSYLQTGLSSYCALSSVPPESRVRTAGMCSGPPVHMLHGQPLRWKVRQ